MAIENQLTRAELALVLSDTFKVDGDAVVATVAHIGDKPNSEIFKKLGITDLSKKSTYLYINAVLTARDVLHIKEPKE